MLFYIPYSTPLTTRAPYEVYVLALTIISSKSTDEPDTIKYSTHTLHGPVSPSSSLSRFICLSLKVLGSWAGAFYRLSKAPPGPKLCLPYLRYYCSCMPFV